MGTNTSAVLNGAAIHVDGGTSIDTDTAAAGLRPVGVALGSVSGRNAAGNGTTVEIQSRVTFQRNGIATVLGAGGGADIDVTGDPVQSAGTVDPQGMTLAGILVALCMLDHQATGLVSGGVGDGNDTVGCTIGGEQTVGGIGDGEAVQIQTGLAGLEVVLSSNIHVAGEVVVAGSADLAQVSDGSPDVLCA